VQPPVGRFAAVAPPRQNRPCGRPHTAWPARWAACIRADAGILGRAQRAPATTTNSWGSPPPHGLAVTLSSLVGSGSSRPGPLQGVGVHRRRRCPWYRCKNSGAGFCAPRPFRHGGNGPALSPSMANSLVRPRHLRRAGPWAADAEGAATARCRSRRLAGHSLGGEGKGILEVLLRRPVLVDSAHRSVGGPADTVISVSSFHPGSISPDSTRLSELTGRWAMPRDCLWTYRTERTPAGPARARLPARLLGRPAAGPKADAPAR